MLTAPGTVCGVDQDSDARGSGRVGNPCRAFCNSPF